jgi:nicotinate phosphoribosyltransferase
MVQPGPLFGRDRSALKPLVPDPARPGLITDLYELTMAAAYWESGVADRRASFELFFRELPPHRGYMVAAGLEQAVQYLLSFRFTAEDISYLQRLPLFQRVSAGWFDALRSLSFTGELWAIPEGSVVFPGEPMLRVTAPVMEAQIAETYLLTCLGYETSVASKAARLVSAARSRRCVDFGSRRAHGPQAGLLAARASFIGGCIGTSNTAAAERLGIAPLGTMAHSWVMAFGDEQEAFRKFAAVFPEDATFLIDTYDTLEGVRNTIRSGVRPGAVRLDSGDLAALSKQVRAVLDEAGWQDVSIFASGDLNEYKIDALLRAGSPIDAFGVGTELATVADAPALGVVYKLVEFEGLGHDAGRLKLSADKRTYPARKQVFRQLRSDGKMDHDVIGLASEPLPGEPLLRQVVDQGELLEPLPALTQIQEHCRLQLTRLPDELKSLDSPGRFAVRISPALQAEFDRLAVLQVRDRPYGAGEMFH